MVDHEALLKSGIKTWFKWKHIEEFTEERIDSFDICVKNGCRVICKDL